MTVGRHGKSVFGLYYWPARDMNLIILLVIFLLALAHLVQHVKARRAVRRARQRQFTRFHPYPPSACKRKPRGPAYRLSVELGNWLYLAIFPKWMYAPESVSDAICSVLYCGLMGFYCWHRTPSIPGDPYPYRAFANMCGIMAYAQTPIVFLLAVKNNPLQPLIGVTYQKLNYLHRASARACIVASWVHTVLWIGPLWVNQSMLRFYVVMGYLALGGFTGLWILSIRIVRRRAYELFLLSHIILSIAFIIGGCLHWPLKSYWIWPSILIWLLDRSYRLFKRVYCNWYCCPSTLLAQDSTVELVGKDVMRVRIRRKGLKWAAGQHFFITAPSLPGMPHESHPFSISNVPPFPSYEYNEEIYEAIFLIRAHGGFTSHLLSALTSASPPSLPPSTPPSSSSSPSLSCAPTMSLPSSPAAKPASIPLTLEGPYGHDHPLEHYSTVVLVAGGTGVTFCLSYFMRLLQPFAGRSSTACRGGRGSEQGKRYGLDNEGPGAEEPGQRWCAGRQERREGYGGKDGDAERLLSEERTGMPGSGPATCLRKLKMIWHVRQMEDLTWIAPMLNTALDALGYQNGGQMELDVSVDVYVTRAIPGQSLSLPPTSAPKPSRPSLTRDGRYGMPTPSSPSLLLHSPTTFALPTATHTPISPLPPTPIGSSQGVALAQTPDRNVYEGSSAEGLADPSRSGRFPMTSMLSVASDYPVENRRAARAGRARGPQRGMSAYADDPDDGTDTDPLLQANPGETNGGDVGHDFAFGAGACENANDWKRDRMGGGDGLLANSAMSGYGSTSSTSSRTRSRSSSTLCSFDRSAREYDHHGTAQTRLSLNSHLSASENGSSDCPYGLSAASRSFIRLYPGRADLSTLIPRITDSSELADAECSEGGEMIVVTCGPVPLMHDARRAVWAANSKERVKKGKRVVHLLEETVGH